MQLLTFELRIATEHEFLVRRGFELYFTLTQYELEDILGLYISQRALSHHLGVRETRLLAQTQCVGTQAQG